MAETKKTVVARLFAEHRGALQAFLYRRVRRQPVAAELAQEVYVRILRVPDIGAIRDPGAYLYTVASNLARDHARRERQHGTVLDVDDSLVQEELAELPGFGGQLDAEQRIKRLSEVLPSAPPEMPRSRCDAVLARTQLRANRTAARCLDAHGQEVPEPGAGALPAPHGAAGVSL